MRLGLNVESLAYFLDYFASVLNYHEHQMSRYVASFHLQHVAAIQRHSGR